MSTLANDQLRSDAARCTTAKTIAILQSNYIPWKGYFDIIAAVDEFVIFDEVQFTRRDWRNRNKIIAGGKPHWLTIPVASKGHYQSAIRDIRVADRGWAETHWRSITYTYGRAAFFTSCRQPLQEVFELASRETYLSAINDLLLSRIAGMLQLSTVFTYSEDVPRSTDDPTRRLVELCVARGATSYLSGPAARAYIEPEQFSEAGIELVYADYTGYPVYDQGSAQFEHGVSIIDLLMRFGPQARDHLKSTRDRRGLFAAA